MQQTECLAKITCELIQTKIRENFITGTHTHKKKKTSYVFWANFSPQHSLEVSYCFNLSESKQIQSIKAIMSILETIVRKIQDKR